MAYRPTRACTVLECPHSPRPGFSTCSRHYLTWCRSGVVGIEPLKFTARRPYVRAARTELTRAFERKADLTVVSTVNHLSAWIEKECLTGTFRPSDLGNRRGIPAKVKLRSALHAIYRRFHCDAEVAALAVLSAALGCALAVRYESETCRKPAHAVASTWSSIWSLVRIKQRRPLKGFPEVHRGLPGARRPVLCGPHLHNATRKAIVDPFAFYLVEDHELTQAILGRLVDCTYGYIDWTAWGRRTHRQLEGVRHPRPEVKRIRRWWKRPAAMTDTSSSLNRKDQ